MFNLILPVNLNLVIIVLNPKVKMHLDKKTFYMTENKIRISCYNKPLSDFSKSETVISQSCIFDRYPNTLEHN